MHNRTVLPILLVALLLASFDAAAQYAPKSKIKGDVKATALVERHASLCEKAATIPGYRIQVASLSGRESKGRAEELQRQIQMSFGDVAVYVIFEEPCFKVKVGDFQTRLEAYAYLHKMQGIYTGTIMRDNIHVKPTIVVPSDLDNGIDTF